MLVARLALVESQHRSGRAQAEDDARAKRRLGDEPVVDERAVPAAGDEHPVDRRAAHERHMVPRDVRIGDDDVAAVFAADRDLRLRR